MTKTMKNLLVALFLTLIMALSLFGVVTFAASAADGIAYVDYTWDGESGTLTSATGSVTEYTAVTETTTAWTTGWYVVSDDVTVAERIKVSGDVHLVLTDDCALTAQKGITVAVDNSLTIYGQASSSGKLTATGDEMNAGIGGSLSDSSNNAYDCGDITINGGIITANSGIGAAGIGGSCYGMGGNIVINDGVVTAIGSDNSEWGGTGIGSGSLASPGTVTIRGGVITANGGAGCGIAGKVTIGGGTVVVNGGIGGNDSSFSTGENGNAVIVASICSNEKNESSWNGIINYTVYGDSVTPNEDFELPNGKTLMVASGQTLTVTEGITLTNNGIITVEDGGSVVVDGTIVNNGTLCYDHNYENGVCTICNVPCAHNLAINGFCSACRGYEEAKPVSDTHHAELNETHNGYYAIENAGQLYWFAQKVNSYTLINANAVLTENIVINEKVFDDDGSLVDDTSALRVWISIGDVYFRGIFDGDGHTISGLYGGVLFNILDTGGAVKNVGVKNSCMIGDTYAASIAYMNFGIVENCWSDATVQTSGYYSGGLVGNNEGIISSCHNLGSTNGGTAVGAIAGFNETSASIINCYFISDNFSSAVGYNTGSVDTLTGGMTNGAAMVLANGKTTFFTDLQAAFESEAVKSGTEDAPATVTLLFDASSESGFSISSAHVILDLNGFNIDSTGALQSTAIMIESGSITVRGDGAITGYGALGAYASIIRVEGGTLEGSYSGISATGAAGSDSELHVSGGTVSGGSRAISYSNLSNFTISGGIFRGTLHDHMLGGSTVQPVITGGGFPDGVKLGAQNSTLRLNTLLGEGCCFVDADGKIVSLTDDQTELSGFVIVKKNISGANVIVSDVTYDGTEQKPAVIVDITITSNASGITDGGSEDIYAGGIVGSTGGGTISDASNSGSVAGSVTIALVEGVDYRVEYSNSRNAGTATVTVIGIGEYAGQVEATFTVNKKAVTVTADDRSICVDGDYELTFTVEGLVGDDTLTVNPELATDANITTAGVYDITVSGADEDGNYSITYVGGNLTVNAHRWAYTAVEHMIYEKCSVCNTDGGVLELGWNTDNHVYDGTDKRVWIKNFALLGKTMADVDYRIDNSLTAVQITDAGTYTATAAVGGAKATMTFEILKATPSYTAPTGLTATYGDSLADVQLPPGFSWQDADTTLVGNAGNNTFLVTFTPEDTKNYNIVTDIEVTVAVGKKSVTVTAENKEVEQFTALPEFTYAVDGMLEGDEFTTAPVASVTITDTKTVGEYEITVSGGENSNYEFNYVGAKLTVTEHTEHRDGTATCTNKAVCGICGEDYGALLEHDYAAATCTVPKTCNDCGATTGEALGHAYDSACDTACNTCGEVRTPAEHIDADENNACDECGAELPKDGLSGGAIAGIAVGSTAVVGGGGFALFWFVFRKKRRI